MNRTTNLLAACLALAGAWASAEEYLMPVFAWQLAGKDGNLWNSELLVTNPGPETRSAWVAGLLPGRQGLQTPCLPPVGPLVVSARSTAAWPAAAIARDLGCPTFAVGGLRLLTDGPVAITSRMVNERAIGKGGAVPATGFGQEIAAVDTMTLPPIWEATMLPGLAWHPNACGPRLFETYLYFANPGETEAMVRVMQDGAGSAGALVVNGAEIATPFEVQIGAGAWIQLKVDPVDSPLTVCLPPEVTDLFYSADGPIVALASVVDRTSQDPRTVVPMSLAP